MIANGTTINQSSLEVGVSNYGHPFGLLQKSASEQMFRFR